jgi:predicted dehydrogenase
MADPLRWGVLGSGNIAGKFAGQLPQCPGARLVAVGSRSAESGRRFADRFGGVAYPSYDELLADDSVEAVYVSLPNSLHREWAVKALEAGKHVLCEKPMASNRAQAIEMFDAARRCDRVLVEAFMYRCHPAIEKLIETVREGAIGQVKLIRSHFTFNRPDAPDDVRFQSQLAGGSMMDVGCYCINLARAVVGGEPTAMHAIAHRHASGVDDYAAGCLDFDGQTLATFTCGMTVEADRTTFIGGSDGYLEIDTPWFSDGTFTLVTDKGDYRQTVRAAASIDPYALEAEAFADVVRDGVDPWISESDTLGNMRALDELRRQVGVSIL